MGRSEFTYLEDAMERHDAASRPAPQLPIPCTYCGGPIGADEDECPECRAKAVRCERCGGGHLACLPRGAGRPDGPRSADRGHPDHRAGEEAVSREPITLRVITSRSRLIGRSETTRREPVVLLDELCWKCKDRHDDKGSCDQCNGVGYITTDAGDALLAFLDRHRA